MNNKPLVYLVANIAFYLIFAFVQWDIFWVKDLPIWLDVERVVLVLIVALVNAIIWTSYRTIKFL